MSPRPSAAAPIVCLIAAIWLIFWPVFTANFVQWDDPDMIWQNPALNPPSWTGLQSAWLHPVNKLYMPVTTTTWTLVAALENKPPGQVLSPLPYHLLNLLLHTAAATAAFVLLKELTGSNWPACIGAMIFALHPIQVETVAWASETKDLLFCLFSVIALCLYARRARSGNGAGGAFAAATLAFALALLSKSAAVSVPLVAAALDRWTFHRPLKKSAPLLLWLAMTVPILTIARLAQPPHLSIPPAWRIAVAVDAIGFYAAKIVLPIHLAIDYERSPHWLIQHPFALWRGCVVLLTAILLLAWRRTSWLRVPIAIVLAALLPVLGLASFDFQNYSTVADHYMYFPMIGIALAVALALQRAPQARVPLMVLIALLSIRSCVQSTHWHDTESLAANQFKIDPDSSTAHKILASWLSNLGRDAEAENEFRAATVALQGEGKSGEGKVWFDFANLLLRHGRFTEAIDQYQLALLNLPPDEKEDRAKVLNNLGMAFYNAGDLNSARAQFHAALNLQPNYADARQNLNRLGGE